MGLFGSPVGHSASPEMYNFCFQHDGLDYAYLAFDVKAEDMPETINTIRLLKMRGGNFTMPCKNIAAKLMDRLSPAAELIGACNAFVNEEGVLTGYITDGVGFVKNLKEHGIEVKGKKVLVLGAGGAATAIQVQLALEGTEEIHIFNRRDEFYDRALETQRKLKEKVPKCRVTVDRLEDREKLQKAVAEADILANATIVGMKPDLHEETLIMAEKGSGSGRYCLQSGSYQNAERSRGSRLPDHRRKRYDALAGSRKLSAFHRERNACRSIPAILKNKNCIEILNLLKALSH